MKCCVISYKGCWQDEQGKWYSSGGFPLQIGALSSLFEAMTLVSVRGKPSPGGIAFPPEIEMVMLHQPQGTDLRRKISALLLIPYYIKELGSAIRQADVVHVPVPGDIPFYGFLMSLLMRKRLIVRYGSSWEATSRTTLMNRVTKSLMRRFAGGPNVMMATGLGEQPPAPGVHWLFSTAITEAEVVAVRTDLHRGVKKPLQLAYVGRFSIEKGVIYLLQALSALRDQEGLTLNDVHLTLIGEGPLFGEYLRYVQRANLQHWVTFAGQMNRPELAQCLAGMDVVVLPSLTESFCKARLDAMLCGVPVVTTEVGFGRQIIGKDGERGWLVPAGEPSELATRISSLIHEPPDWSSLRKRCRTYAEKYTLERWVDRIGEICEAQWTVRVSEGKLIS